MELLHAKSVTQRSLYTESFSTQTRLHTETFTQRNLYTESFCTRKLLRTEKSLHRRAFTQKLSHTEGSFYTKKSLHRETFTETLTHKSFYTEKSLHRGAFTRSNKLKLGAVLQENPSQELSGTHLLPKKPSISNKYVSKNLRNIFLKQVLIQQLSSPHQDEMEGRVVRRSRR